MNREEVLAVLAELLSTFETMKSAPIVSISKVEKSSDWELQVKWLVESNEKAELTNFAIKHGLHMREKNECTYFR